MVGVPLILGTLHFTALAVIIANMLTDLVYGVLDRRVRH